MSDVMDKVTKDLPKMKKVSAYGGECIFLMKQAFLNYQQKLTEESSWVDAGTQKFMEVTTLCVLVSDVLKPNEVPLFEQMLKKVLAARQPPKTPSENMQ